MQTITAYEAVETKIFLFFYSILMDYETTTMADLILDLESRVVLLEGSRDINRQQEAEKIEAPKGQVSHSKSSTNMEPPSRSSIILFRL